MLFLMAVFFFNNGNTGWCDTLSVSQTCPMKCCTQSCEKECCSLHNTTDSVLIKAVDSHKKFSDLSGIKIGHREEIPVYSTTTNIFVKSSHPLQTIPLYILKQSFLC